MKQHNKPCGTCPFRVGCDVAYQNAHVNVLQLLGQVYGPFRLPCHDHPNYRRKATDQSVVPECAGAAVFRTHINRAAKLPRLLALPPNPDVFPDIESLLTGHGVPPDFAKMVSPEILMTRELGKIAELKLLNDDGSERSDVEVFTHPLTGQKLTNGEIEAKLGNELYPAEFGGKDCLLVKTVVNKGIDSRLQACYVPDRGDAYILEQGRLKCRISGKSLAVLVRRLYEWDPTSVDHEEAVQLADDIVESLNRVIA